MTNKEAPHVKTWCQDGLQTVISDGYFKLAPKESMLKILAILFALFGIYSLYIVASGQGYLYTIGALLALVAAYGLWFRKHWSQYVFYFFRQLTSLSGCGFFGRLGM